MTKYHLTVEFDNEEDLRAYLGGETRVAAAPEPAASAAQISTNPESRSDDNDSDDAPGADAGDARTDSDGMPYDETLHASPPSFKQDGTWRAKRGKTKDADAARAAFKAAGGNVQAPEAERAAAPAGMPSMPGSSMPGAATSLPADAPEPVSLERVIEKINGMLERGKAKPEDLGPMYAKHSGVTAEDSFGVFSANETARASLFGALCEIEPELS